MVFSSCSEDEADRERWVPAIACSIGYASGSNARPYPESDRPGRLIRQDPFRDRRV